MLNPPVRRASGFLPIQWTLLALLFLLLAACSVFPRRITYRSPGVAGSGTQGAYSTRILYDSLEIGSPERPLESVSAVTLKLPDGTTLRTDRLDVSGLRKGSTRILQHPPLRADRGWPSNLEEICLGAYSFLVVEGKVVSILIGSGRPSGPAHPPAEIGDAGGTAFYRFPLTQKQLVRLFGKPETLHKDPSDLL